MPGTETEVDVCICFSNNCNGINGEIDIERKSNVFGMNDEKESNDWEISSISQHPDFKALSLRWIFHRVNRI